MGSLPAALEIRAPKSSQLGEFATSLSVEQLPGDVMVQTKRHVLDSLGIALAASKFRTSSTSPCASIPAR